MANASATSWARRSSVSRGSRSLLSKFVIVAASDWAASLPVTREEVVRACRYAAIGFDNAEPASPAEEPPVRRSDTSAAARNLANLEERLAKACAALHVAPADLQCETPSRLDRICEAAAVELGKTVKSNEAKLRADYDLTYREIYLRLKKEKEARTSTTPEDEGPKDDERN